MTPVITPFECLVPTLGGTQKVLRPLLHVLQYRTLPGFIARNSWLLSEMLADTGFSRSVMEQILRVTARDPLGPHWPSGMPQRPGFEAYLQGLLAPMHAERFEHEDGVNWVIHMPAPVAVPEAHLMAVWGLPKTGQPGTKRPRCFTLEHSGPQGLCMIAELEGATRFNRGPSPLLSAAEFDQRVAAIVHPPAAA
jgi:hypothetical protein